MSRLGFEEWPQQIADADIPANNNIVRLEAYLNLSVVSATTTSAPGSPTDGDVYILPAGESWTTGSAGNIVVRYDGAWVAFTAKTGTIALAADTGKFWYCTADDTWVQLGLDLGEISTPSQWVANTDNFALATNIRVLRASSDASRDLTGMTAALYGGRRVTICNIGAQNIVIKHDATSTAANRFYCPGSADFTLNANDAVDCLYDLTSARWRVLAA